MSRIIRQEFLEPKIEV